MNVFLEKTLKLKRCPHCSVDNPNLIVVNEKIQTQADNGYNPRNWGVYKCARCGGIVTAETNYNSKEVVNIYPKPKTVNEILPTKVKAFLQQAIDSVYAPAGSIMLCASAVDAMFKEKGYTEGSLFSRIDKASNDHLITSEMAKWAHQVRLEANDQRHSDIDAELPTIEEAKQAIEFTETLSEFLFVLPSKVTRGIKATATSKSTDSP